MLYFQPGSRTSYSIGPRPGARSGPLTTPCSRSRRRRSAQRRRRRADDHPALAGRRVLDGVEAEDHQVARGADLDAFVERADGVRGVLDDDQAVLPRQRAQRVEVRRLPGVVDRHDRARPRSDPAGDVLRVEAERPGVHVGEHRPRAGQLDHVRRRRPRQRGNDHLIAGFQVQHRDGQVQSAGGGIDGDGLRRVQPLAEQRLELRHLRPGGDPAGAERLDDLGDFRILDGRAAERQESGAAAQGSSSSSGAFGHRVVPYGRGERETVHGGLYFRGSFTRTAGRKSTNAALRRARNRFGR